MRFLSVFLSCRKTMQSYELYLIRQNIFWGGGRGEGMERRIPGRTGGVGAGDRSGAAVGAGRGQSSACLRLPSMASLTLIT